MPNSRRRCVFHQLTIEKFETFQVKPKTRGSVLMWMKLRPAHCEGVQVLCVLLRLCTPTMHFLTSLSLLFPSTAVSDVCDYLIAGNRSMSVIAEFGKLSRLSKNCT